MQTPHVTAFEFEKFPNQSTADQTLSVLGTLKTLFLKSEMVFRKMTLAATSKNN